MDFSLLFLIPISPLFLLRSVFIKVFAVWLFLDYFSVVIFFRRYPRLSLEGIGDLCEPAYEKPRDNSELPTQNYFVYCMKYHYVKYGM